MMDVCGLWLQCTGSHTLLAGLLFLCSTDEGRRLFEEDAALLLLHEAVFGLAFANDLEVQLLALQTLFKLAHLPKVAAFLASKRMPRSAPFDGTSYPFVPGRTALPDAKDEL